MKIAIPSLEGKLCAHFGHSEYFTFVEIEDNKIVNIETDAPEEGVSCHSFGWVAQKGTDIVLAGGMGGRPLAGFEENNVKVILGCPEVEIEQLVQSYLDGLLVAGENTCGGGHHECHHHGEGCCH